MSKSKPMKLPCTDATIVTNGHNRINAALLAGIDSVLFYWDEDELDVQANAVVVKCWSKNKIHVL